LCHDDDRYIALSGLGNLSYIVTQGYASLHPGLWVHCPSRTGVGTLTFKKAQREKKRRWGCFEGINLLFDIKRRKFVDSFVTVRWRKER